LIGCRPPPLSAPAPAFPNDNRQTQSPLGLPRWLLGKEVLRRFLSMVKRQVLPPGSWTRAARPLAGRLGKPISFPGWRNVRCGG
jgi:hypothetical protein